MSETRLIRLAEFGRAQGLGGEVRLKSYTADPLAVARYGTLQAGDGRAIVLTAARTAPGGGADMLVVRVEGVGTREAAERLNRVALFVPRERLAPPEEDEFYLADLVGLRAEGPDGFAGQVVAVPDYGGGELLEIAPEGGRRTLLLPFTRAYVPEIDIVGGRIAITPPDGWLEDRPDASR